MMDALWQGIASAGAVTLIAGDPDRLTRAAALQSRPVMEGGARLALSLRDPVALARILIAYDGHADMLLLASAELPPDDVQALAQEAGAHVIVSDRSDVGGAQPVRALLGDGMPSGNRPTKWVLTTSGTTGRPKLIEHRLGGLIRTIVPAKVDQPLRIWGLTYEATRFAGLQVVLQALLGGGTLVALPSAMSIGEKLTNFAQHNVTHLSATPTLWRRILMHPASKNLELFQITLGGEIADQHVLDQLRERFPSSNITHIYASTEVGVGFSVKDGLTGFPESWLEQDRAGIALRIREGKLWVRVPGEAGRSLGAAAISRDADGFIDTHDMIVRENGRIRFLGRDSGVVNVGGAKVHPETVENVLNAAPQVAVSKVSARRNPLSGAILVAEVVPTITPPDPAAFKTELLRHCRDLLPPEAVPALIILTDRLDINAAGKLTRG